MKKILLSIFMTVSLFMLIPISYASASNSPLGYWKTIDDVTGKPKSILKIFMSGGALYGQVVKIFPRPGYDQNELCTACTGYRHNKKIVGMVIMEGLHQNPNSPAEWSGGTIMDPLNGKTYKCYITLISNGQKLNVRGYIGISLFGRTQTWIRVPKP